RVNQVLVLRHIQPKPQVKDRPGRDRDAGAIRSGTRLEGLFQLVQVFLPSIGVLKLLGHEVVNGGATRPAREFPRHPVRRRGPPGGTATHLEDTSAQFTQDTAKSPAFSTRGGPSGVSPALRSRAEPERASPHAVAD